MLKFFLFVVSLLNTITLGIDVRFWSGAKGDTWVYQYYKYFAGMGENLDIHNSIRSFEINNVELIRDTTFIYYKVTDSALINCQDMLPAYPPCPDPYCDSQPCAVVTSSVETCFVVYPTGNIKDTAFFPLFEISSKPSDSCSKIFYWNDSLYYYHRELRTDIDIFIFTSIKQTYLERYGLCSYNWGDTIGRVSGHFHSLDIRLLAVNGRVVDQYVSTEYRNLSTMDKRAQIYPLCIYPNPFNISSLIKYKVPNDGSGLLSVYSNDGKLILKQTVQGHGTFNWNAGKIGSGVYLCKLSTGHDVFFRKLLLMR